VLDEVLAVAAVRPNRRIVGWAEATWSIRSVPATESCTLAAATSTARVSVAMLRVRPTTAYCQDGPAVGGAVIPYNPGQRSRVLVDDGGGARSAATRK
jgi:hypothetical protein